MRLVIEIALDNAAFQDDPGELARILTALADRWDGYTPSEPAPFDRSSPLLIHDVNGNYVGQAMVLEA